MRCSEQGAVRVKAKGRRTIAAGRDVINARTVHLHVVNESPRLLRCPGCAERGVLLDQLVCLECGLDVQAFAARLRGEARSPPPAQRARIDRDRLHSLLIAIAVSLITTLAVLAWSLFPPAHVGARAALLHISAAMVAAMAMLWVRFWWTQAPASA